MKTTSDFLLSFTMPLTLKQLCKLNPALTKNQITDYLDILIVLGLVTYARNEKTEIVYTICDK